MNKRAGSFPLFISSKTRYHAEYNISKVLLRWLKGFARFDWLRIASYVAIITPREVITAIFDDSVRGRVKTVRNAEYNERKIDFEILLRRHLLFWDKPFSLLRMRQLKTSTFVLIPGY